MPSVAYAYIRYSSMAQASGGTVERQVNPLNEFTKQTGIDVKETIIDEGVSSFKGKNVTKGRFKEILDRIDSGLIRRGDYIVVESIDRITRQRVLDGVELLQGILKKGIRIYTTSDRRCYSYDDPAKDLETLMMIALISKRANEESETKSWRRKSSWIKAKENAANGVVKINKKNPPYGLIYDDLEGRFVIEESEAKEVRKIFELLKYMGVSNAIRDVNVWSKRKWANRHVVHMINSQYPLGVLRSQRRTVDGKKEFVEYIEGYYPAIIGQADFNDAVDAMKRRRDRKVYGNTSAEDINIFRGSVKCGVCGGSLIFEKQRNPKGVVYFYLNCYSKKELKGACDQRFRFDLAFGMALMFMKFAMSSNEKIGYRKLKVIPRKLGEGVAGKSTKERPPGGFIHRKIKIDPVHRENYLSAVYDTKDALVNLFSGADKEDVKLNQDLIKANGELQKAQGELDRYERSIDQYEGAIPNVIIKKIGQLESYISEKTHELEDLNRKVSASNVSLPVYDVQDVINMFRVRSGRLEINRFFSVKKIRFEFQYQSVGRTLRMTVTRDGLKLLELVHGFPLHNPLGIFNLPNLAEFCLADG